MVEPILETGPMRSEADLQLQRKLELLALWMDGVFRIPGVGIRFGLDSLIGLLPGVGDALTSMVSLYILSAASRFGVPRSHAGQNGPEYRHRLVGRFRSVTGGRVRRILEIQSAECVVVAVGT